MTITDPFAIITEAPGKRVVRADIHHAEADPSYIGSVVAHRHPDGAISLLGDLRQWASGDLRACVERQMKDDPTLDVADIASALESAVESALRLECAA